MNLPPNIIHMESSFSWSELLGGGLTTLLVSKYIEYRKRKKEARVDMAQNSKEIAEVFRIMRHIAKATFYPRVMVFVGEDSAGVLAVGKNLYVTCQYEEIIEECGMSEIREEIQRWRADAAYYDIYSEMLMKGFVLVKTKDMPPSKLKTIYEMQGIKSAYICHLMTTKDHSKVFYCSIASNTKEEPTQEDTFIINSSVDKLVEIFARHKKYY